jgi:hypothetical protein
MWRDKRAVRHDVLFLSVGTTAVCQWERSLHCFSAAPVLVAQYSLVLFSHIQNFKHATGPQVGH